MGDRKRLKRMQLLARKWEKGILEEPELSEFREWLGASADDPYTLVFEDEIDRTKHKELLFERIVKATNLKRPNRNIFPLRYAVAAACLVLVGLMFFLLPDNRQKDGTPVDLAATILPGERKVEVRLANGKHALLDGADGILVFQPDEVAYADGREVKLTTRVTARGETARINWVSTPKGGEYQVKLPDGSMVWLNADTELGFVADEFGQSNREVTLRGEAFFDVEKGKQPFVVITDGQRVEALGTRFNIKSYRNETTTTTTLVSGRVRVSAQGTWGTDSEVVLNPQEQALLDESGLITQRVGDGSDVAWVKGIFDFTGKDVQEVMRQLERWYDLEVSYAGEPPNMKFWGRMSRNLNLGQVLKLLKSAALSFEVKDRKHMVISTSTKGGQSKESY